MSASFPGAVRVFTLKHNVTDINFAEDVNALQDEVTVIERVLGINPHGNYSDIVSRLNGVDTSLANKAALTHSHTGSTAAAAVPLDGSVQMTGLLLLSNQTPTNINHAARKKYVDDSVNALPQTSVQPFGQGGSAIAGSHGSLANLKLQGNSDVVTTNSAGGFTISFPQQYPTGVLVVVPAGGDIVLPGTSPVDITVINDQVTKSAWGGKATHPKDETGIGNAFVRVNWVSLGW